MNAVIPVTPQLLTRDATLDDMSAGDYFTEFLKVRARMSPGAMVKEFGNPEWTPKETENHRQYFFRYERGEMDRQNREMRNVLRRAQGLPTLPPTVADCVALASPDAAVWRIGDGIPETVIMVAGGAALDLHVNSSVALLTDSTQGDATNAAEPLQADTQYKRTRKPSYRPTCPPDVEEWIKANAIDPQEVYRRGMETIKAERGE